MRKTFVTKPLGIGAIVILGAWVHACQTQFPLREGNLQVVDRAQIVYAPPAISVPAVRLSINGRPPMLFLLASAVRVPIAIDIEKAKQLGIHNTGVVALDSVQLVDAQGQLSRIRHSFPQVVVAPLSLGRTVLGEEIAGVLGSGFFATMPVRLDFRNNRMELISSTASSIMERARDQYIAIKISPLADHGKVHTMPVFLPGGRRVEMVIATESAVSYCVERDLRGVELMEICPSLYRTKQFVEKTKELFVVNNILARLQWLSFGSFNIEDVWLVIESELVKQRSVIGMDILSCFDEVILDYATGYLLLKKPQGKVRGRLDGVSGISVHRDSSGRIVVRSVLQGSAGQRAGFQVGDRIVAVAGKAVDAWLEEGVQMLLDGYAGVTQSVTIEREGSVKELSITPENGCSLFAFPGSGRFGFSAILATVGNETYFLVTQIVSNHARRAGLRVGDRIIAMNGYIVHEHREKLPSLVRDAKVLELRVKRFAEDSEITLRISEQEDKREE